MAEPRCCWTACERSSWSGVPMKRRLGSWFGVAGLVTLTAFASSVSSVCGGVVPSQPDFLRMADPVSSFPTTLTDGPGPLQMTLSNGFISRTFTRVAEGGGFATTAFKLEANDGTHFTRGVAPEARIVLDGGMSVDVGGLVGQQQYLVYYPDETTLSTNPMAMSFINFTTSPVVTQYDFLPRWGVANSTWPPKGLHLAVTFGPPADSGNGTFITLNNTGVGCAPPDPCLTGWPTCDNASVPGQCSFPKTTARELCAAWPACVAVTCNPGRSDCQARGSLTQLYPGDFTSYIKGGWFGYHDLRVTVHTEMYDGIPALSRWLTIAMANGSTAPGPIISQASIDLLHVPWNLRARLHAETAYMPSLGIRNSGEDAGYYPASGNYAANFTSLTSPPVSLWVYDEKLMGPWGVDDAMEYWYDMGMNETMLDAKFPFGPGVNITDKPLTTFRVYEMLYENEDVDRQGLARRKLLRTVAPQVQMDITPFYSVGGDSASIRSGADLASSLGFRGLHTSVNPFDMSPAHIATVKADVAYAHSKGLAVGFYVLLQNPPGMSEADEIINPNTGKGEGIACFATEFHRNFRNGIVAFVQATGFDFLDTDGPFEQAPCGSTHHEYHAGLIDSQFAQWYENVEWYRTLPSAPNPLSLVGRGIMVSCPDPYELAAGTWNQPIGFTDAWGRVSEPWTWLLLGRTYIHDGTYWKPPTNGGVNFDLNRAGDMATPEELQFYDTGMATFIGAAGRDFQGGVLYKNNASKAIITKWMAILNKYRAVLNGDIVHVVKPSGRSWDAMMHVLPSAAAGEPRAFILFYNPSSVLGANVSTSLSVYYAGFDQGATVTVLWSDGTSEKVVQDASFSLRLQRVIPAHGYDWAVLS